MSVERLLLFTLFGSTNFFSLSESRSRHLKLLFSKAGEQTLTKSAGEGKPMKRTARMFDDRATPRSPFVVAYSPRSHPDTPTDSSLSSTLRLLLLYYYSTSLFTIPAF